MPSATPDTDCDTQHEQGPLRARVVRTLPGCRTRTTSAAQLLPSCGRRRASSCLGASIHSAAARFAAGIRGFCLRTAQPVRTQPGTARFGRFSAARARAIGEPTAIVHHVTHRADADDRGNGLAALSGESGAVSAELGNGNAVFQLGRADQVLAVAEVGLAAVLIDQATRARTAPLRRFGASSRAAVEGSIGFGAGPIAIRVATPIVGGVADPGATHRTRIAARAWALVVEVAAGVVRGVADRADAHDRGRRDAAMAREFRLMTGDLREGSAV